MSIVRPFPARVVRPEHAGGAVTALLDSLEENGAGSGGVDAGAYDESPAALYVYRQQDEAGSHLALVCEVAIGAFVDGRVRGHEEVHARRVEALIQHHATMPDTAPALVVLLHRAGTAFTRALDATVQGVPILDFAGPGGRHQTVWRVAEDAAARVTEELAAADHYYIADGHHRVAAALEEWRQDGRPAEPGLLCVVHPMEELRLAAFHRRVTGPVDPGELLGLLTAGFEVREVAEPPAPVVGSFGLYVRGRWFDVCYRGSRADGPAGLDVAVLQDRVLSRLAELAPGPSYDVQIAPARTSVDELTQRCDADGGALFTLAPPPIEVLTGLADAGELMPPKTTFFEPKPCAGIFLRP